MITYLEGDATVPTGEVPKIIAHVCNDIGGWGRGFVKAISAKWPEPERSYRLWYSGEAHPYQRFGLGEVRFVPVDDGNIIVANMIGQVGVYSANGKPPVRYSAIKQALLKVAEKAKSLGATVHMPRIGCGRAGGEWDKVEPLIEETLQDVDVYVYDLPKK